MNKIILTSVIVGIAAMMMLSVLPAMAVSAQTGNIKDIHPPTNDGTRNGVGFIDGDDGKKYVFHTPEDNNGELLTVGSIVFFTLSENGKHIESVSHTNPDDPDTCPGFPGATPPCPDTR